MHFNFGPKDIVGVIKRRFFWAAIPFLLTALIALSAIRLMDPIYESSATLLVEDQQIRNDFVSSAVESDALQRIEAISARVQARDNLLAIANELGLYTSGDLNATQRFDRMREDTKIAIRRVASSNRRTDSSAITVRIAYRSRSGVRAQRVTNALLTDFQSRSVDLRTEIASETSDFLREEEIKIRRRLDEVGTAINEIKTENVDSLPENRTIYERALDRATTERTRIETQISETDQAIRMLELQRPLIMRQNPDGSSDDAELLRKRRILDALQREYQDSYPDVIAMKQEVLALEYDIDPSAFRDRAQREIASLNTRMAAAGEGTDTYDQLLAEKESLQSRINSLPPDAPNVNLTALQFNAQVETLQNRLRAYERQLEDVEARIIGYEEQIAATPVVEGQLFRLEEEREQLQRDLSILRTKLADAERSESLELQSKGERLTTIEQPTRPDQPVSPDKPRLAIMGTAVAGIIAALFALTPEVLFARVRSREHLEAVYGPIRIVEVPDFEDNGWSKIQLAMLALQVLVTVGLAGAVAFSAAKTLL